MENRYTVSEDYIETRPREQLVEALTELELVMVGRLYSRDLNKFIDSSQKLTEFFSKGGYATWDYGQLARKAYAEDV